MNRIDRLFGILLLLQNRKLIRAQDIASRFEISERTVYRDIAALSELGVPISAQAGEGYSLMTGFYLPPLVLTPDEASAAFIGVRMLKESGNLTIEADSLLQKLTAALPHETLQTATRRANIVQFMLAKGKFDLRNPMLVDLQHAILGQQVVFLRYFSWSEHAITEREVEPIHLTYGEGIWYFTGFCRLRQEIRSFRLDRVELLELRAEHFPLRSASADSPSPEIITVEVKFSVETARWVRERQHYAFYAEQTTDDGKVIMVFRISRLSEIQNWLMGWGASAEVITPVELRQQIRDEAQKLISLLT